MKFAGKVLTIDCHAEPMRAIGLREKWWVNDPQRICTDCMQEVGDG